jgi:hypothetical protein
MVATSKRNTQNSLVWNLTTIGGFTVNSAYHFLNNPGIPNTILNNLWPLQLNYKLGHRTAQNKQRKNWSAIHSCIMCTTTSQETADYLFYSCPTAQALYPALPQIMTSPAGSTAILQSWCMAAGTTAKQQWAVFGQFGRNETDKYSNGRQNIYTQ